VDAVGAKLAAVDPEHKGKQAAECEVSVAEGAQIDDRLRAVSTRAKNAAADRPETTASSAMIGSSSQSYLGPSSSTYSRVPRNPAMASKPIQSSHRNSFGSGRSKSTSSSTAIVTRTPGITLMKNSQCQDSASVM